MKEKETLMMTPVVELRIRTMGNNCCDDSQGECDFDY